MNPTISKLNNGLTVITDPMPGFQSVSVGIWVDVGARHEKIERHGISHFLEHMAFKGTERRDALKIAEEIENVGGAINAYTSREQTAYFARVLKEDTELALDILSDILQNSLFLPKEIERERDVILQEIGQSLDTPDDIIFDYLQETVFPKQAVGRPILGTADSVRSFSQPDLKDHMASYYGAEAMTLVASGGVDHQEIMALADKFLSGLPSRSSRVLEAASYVGGDFRMDKELEQAHVALAMKGVTYGDDDFYVASVFSTLFGGGMSSRLFQEIREKRGLAYSVFSFSSSFADDGVFGIYAGTSGDQVAELPSVMIGELEKAAKDVGEEEVNRARAQLKAGMLMAMESSSTRCEQIARQMSVFGEILDVETLAKKIDAVDVDRTRAFAARLLKGPQPTIAAMGPISGLENHASLAARFG